jgi:periplasmic protein TonB
VFSPLPTRRIRLRSAAVSLSVHATLGLALFVTLRSHPVRVFNLPGTASGTHLELAYLPGRAPAPAVRPKAKVAPKPAPTPVAPKPQPPPPDTASSPNVSSPTAATPDATSGSDSWGSGAVQIAFTTFSPSPAPDLSTLPHGVQGDVVIDVTIDSQGKVSNLEVLRTLGYGIDSSVVNTLRSWTFRPATKDGTPIASVQELHFHYGPV